MVKKATRISRFVAAVEDRPVFVGLDVHKKTYSVALFEPEDGLIETYTCPSGEAKLADQFCGLGCRIAHVVYESGPTGFALARALEAAGFAVSVIAASRIPRMSAASAKTDRLDAEKLASYFARGLLRPIAIPTVEQEGYRALVRRRKRIAEARGKIKQKIKGFLLVTGIGEPVSLRAWSVAASDDLNRLPLPSEHRMALSSMVREYLFLLDEDRQLRAQIRAATRRMHPERYARLTSVIGVGETVATNFLAELFSPDRFNRPEEVTSYLGLAPVVSQSGGGPARSKLRRVGQRRLRGILVEAAWQWTWRDPEAKALYNHHIAKTGIAQKAICAVARKLAIRLWRMTVETPHAPMEGAASGVRSGKPTTKKGGTLINRCVPKTVLGADAFTAQARIRKGLREPVTA